MDDGTAGREAPSASVQSLARGLAVIRAFDGENPEMTLSEVARRTELSRATARRFLHTLVELGYVRTDGKNFALTARVLDLGYSYLSGLSLPEIAQPHLERLAAAVQESTSASVLDGTDIVYVARVPTKRIMSVAISIGTRFPAYATSMGRVLLAALPVAEATERIAGESLSARTPATIVSADALTRELEKVRASGYAFIDQELEVGLRSMAVAITDGRGRTIAAINVSGHAVESTAEAFRARVAGPLRDAARAIETDLRSAKPVSNLLVSG
ncbi:IclR family transcriptional regulator domain-containing protein [Salinibacterium hongtaonis]|uniref:IclR family transcriptional regulator domain-containing protein n=1 Tax=Homoserinimonas hongtaonis TaxID=2079791 RepID=UPI000D3D56DF|nr:IclR family transcriptional regulator C-terminal domain-containing protein [Salinibacterium hongtaonis]AWB88838.1 IclR family transcriptional regulator [Salinibacterium hongtaonis]